jgi:DNA polymerase-3 subunit gamma/tau
MAVEQAHEPDPENRIAAAGEYLVVARRYRPADFGDLVGQDLVARALQNAIATDRVGHAYLFTGARGVGKTSTARILAKALNCVHGPASTPCGHCDICQSIATGDDVDVLEIDGASNRGIDEIRQLRASVNVRPGRSRYKIYIIDEVHMLTREAFNALLKTLEEPPDHVKFIFCTTAPEKIPITVLSRCQRFDFPPVATPAIVERLQQIVRAEQADADSEALELLARRANGSMRDSQSLLEQLLAFGGERIAVDDVHQMLGTAGASQLMGVLEALHHRDAGAALNRLDAVLQAGVDAGQLAEQLVGGFRDVMMLAAGGNGSLLLYTAESDLERMQELAGDWGLPSLLAAVQILDQALARMRLTTHPRILLEVALVRIAHLADLDSLPELIARLRTDQRLPTTGEVAGSKKKTAVELTGPPRPVDAGPAPAAAAPTAPVAPDAMPPDPDTDLAEPASASAEVDEVVVSAEELWQAAIGRLEGMMADCAAHFSSAANSAPNRLVVTFPAMYNSSKAFCDRPERRAELERIVSEVAGRPMRVDFRAAAPDGEVQRSAPKPARSGRQLLHEAAAHPLVRQAVEMFAAEVVDVQRRRERD